jgi:hypothetical protein
VDLIRHIIAAKERDLLLPQVAREINVANFFSLGDMSKWKLLATTSPVYELCVFH